MLVGDATPASTKTAKETPGLCGMGDPLESTLGDENTTALPVGVFIRTHNTMHPSLALMRDPVER